MSTKNNEYTDIEEERNMEELLDQLMPLVQKYGIGRIVIACTISIYVLKGEKPHGAIGPLADDLRQIGCSLIEENV